jgi:nucleoside-diphosphate-sugar epimerase
MPLATPQNAEELEDLLTQPNEADIAAAAKLGGDVVVLGAGGKMGPSLVVRLKRAIAAAGMKHRVIAVLRKDRDGVFAQHASGVEVVEADLLQPESYERLPDVPNIVYMTARKFGSTGDQSMTWATNVWMAGLAANRYKGQRTVAFSTGNVYPFTPVQSAGANEQTPVAPVGEYAQSALGRERFFEYFSNAYGTPVLIYRLNYAVDLRYGVLVDIGQKVMQGIPIDVSMGHANVIWQGDALSYAIRSFALCSTPATVLNVTGSTTVLVREVAEQFGKRFGKQPTIVGREAETALLSDSSLCTQLLGPTEVSENELFEMTAEWLLHGGTTLGKPTKFERRDGSF